MNWPLILIGAPTLALGLLAHGCGPAKPSPSEVRHVRAASTTAQVRLNADVAKATAQSRKQAARAARTVNEAAHELEHATGAATPVPPAVSAVWSDTIDRLRDDAARAHADAAEGDAAAGVPGAVPSAGPSD